MVLNKRGGNKSKKQKSADSKTGGRPLRLKDPQPDSSELYGRVTKRNGGNPPIIQVMCEDGVERNCVVRGKMRNRVWMNPNDFVIIIYNKDSSSNAGEIDYKYDPQEVTKLEKLGELSSEKFRTEKDLINQDDGFVFATEETAKEDADYYNMHSGSSQRITVADLDGNNDDDDFNFDDI